VPRDFTVVPGFWSFKKKTLNPIVSVASLTTSHKSEKRQRKDFGRWPHVWMYLRFESPAKLSSPAGLLGSSSSPSISEKKKNTDKFTSQQVFYTPPQFAALGTGRNLRQVFSSRSGWLNRYQGQNKRSPSSDPTRTARWDLPHIKRTVLGKIAQQLFLPT